MSPLTTILILAKPSYRRKSIEAAIHALGNVRLIGADDSASAAQLILTEKPDYLMVDSFMLDDSTCGLCNSLRSEDHATRCVLLLEPPMQIPAACREADLIVIKVQSTLQLVDALQKMVKANPVS